MQKQQYKLFAEEREGGGENRENAKHHVVFHADGVANALIVAASEKSEINYTTADYTGPVAIVMGAEQTGISPEVLRQCDTIVSIPQFGHIGSLNVSVAAGVMMYEVVRQRLAAGLTAND